MTLKPQFAKGGDEVYEILSENMFLLIRIPFISPLNGLQTTK